VRHRDALRSTGDDFRLPASVYPPGADTFLLISALRELAMPCQVLEIGCGSGAVSMELARRGATVVATDLNPEALRYVQRSAARDHLAIGLVRTDLAAGLGRFDVIVANPPYLSTPIGFRDPDPWVRRAVDGGPDGCDVLDRIVESLPDHLTPRATAYLVVSSVQSRVRREQIWSRWRDRGGSIGTVEHQSLEGESLDVLRFRAGSNPADTPRSS
jgi:release factor glutamine methyltransferase